MRPGCTPGRVLSCYTPEGVHQCIRVLRAHRERAPSILGRAANDGLLQALGEAEVELAAMNAAGVIDAVLTNDGDILVFGALAVMRK